MKKATRLLVLGALLERPLHGYEIRHELERQRVDQWSNVAYGSIYYSLGRMAKEELLEVAATEAGRGGRGGARTVYAITERGRMEFQRLLRDFWWDHELPKDRFQLALAYMDQLPREELIAALHRRAAVLRAELPTPEQSARKLEHAPRHVAESLRLATAHIQVELDWIEQAVAKVERGDLP